MTEDFLATDPEHRLLILAPTRRDAGLVCDILQQSGIKCVPCADLPELCRHLQDGAGGVLITEEAFAGKGEQELLGFLAEQPPWSDLPVIFLTRRGEHSALAQQAVESLGNILLLERPTKTSMLVSTARAALRERRRQYQTRSHLEMLRVARDAAEDASRAKSEFLANMSHEIRTPMTVFMSAIEHLLVTDMNPARRHLLTLADISARRLRTLIDDILDFSRIEARKIEIEEESFDLRNCVQEAVDMFTLPAREKGLRLESEVSADTPELIVGDPNRVGQVLINLLGNAVKFTQEGEIRLSIRLRGHALEFAVADTGIGIPEEKRHLLFQSFSQLDMSFCRQHGGSGLGLAISKGLVELMGGELSVGSRNGQGSVFTFTLPLKTASSSSAEPVETPSEGPEGKPNLQILLVDDEPMIREMITITLAGCGLQVDTAETGRDAVRKWEAGNFDIILMDLQMPQMNGMEATQAIREKEKAGKKPTCIIGLTAHVRREVKEECLASGMNHVLVKPVQITDLLAAIHGCVGSVRC